MDSTTAMNNIKVILLQKYLARRLSSERERVDQFWWMTLPTLAKDCVTPNCLQIWLTGS